jgi:hypothetical protein
VPHPTPDDDQIANPILHRSAFPTVASHCFPIQSRELDHVDHARLDDRSLYLSIDLHRIPGL